MELGQGRGDASGPGVDAAAAGDLGADLAVPVAREACVTSGDCATGQCRDGTCQGDGRCLTERSSCEADEQCCNGLCDAGACRALTRCQTAGERCEEEDDCCSSRCAEVAPGERRCAPLGGCRVFRELCRTDADCCNAAVAAGVCERFDDQRGLGRCANPPGCAPPGEVCAVDDDDDDDEPNACCGTGDVAGVCAPSGVPGVDRCRAPGDACLDDGEGCAVPAACCSGRCDRAPDEERFACRPASP